MRGIFIITVALSVMLYSCDVEPYADFSVSKRIVEINEIVYFTNYSNDAKDFVWDFGDGYVSYVTNPQHAYETPGLYTVRLEAHNDGDADFAYQDIEVLPPPEPTVLEITVLEYYDLYPVPEASILIYPTLNDWNNETNAIVEVFTDNNGIAVVEGLDPLQYYLDVWHANHDNYTLAEEDVNFILTPPLVRGEVVEFTAYVDYYDRDTKSAVRSQAKKMKSKRTGPARTFEVKK